MFQGSYVAIITPFKDGVVDDKKLKDLVEWHISEGTNGIVPVGTTGECATLSHKEHEHVIEVVAKTVRGRVSVIAGTGSNSTSEAIHLTQRAKELGCDGALLVSPYYNRPTQEGLIAHFSAVARAVSIPLVLYNIPSRTGVSILPDTLETLVKENPTIVGIKESSGSMDQVSEIFKKCGDSFCVLSGDDSLTFPIMALGGKGVISVAANLLPRAVSDLCRLCLEGEWERARELHLKLFPLFKALFLETNPSPIKAAMKEAGLIEDESLRLPLVSIRPQTRQALKAAMERCGFAISSIKS